MKLSVSLLNDSSNVVLLCLNERKWVLESRKISIFSVFESFEILACSTSIEFSKNMCLGQLMSNIRDAFHVSYVFPLSILDLLCRMCFLEENVLLFLNICQCIIPEFFVWSYDNENIVPIPKGIIETSGEKLWPLIILSELFETKLVIQECLSMLFSLIKPDDVFSPYHFPEKLLNAIASEESAIKSISRSIIQHFQRYGDPKDRIIDIEQMSPIISSSTYFHEPSQHMLPHSVELSNSSSRNHTLEYKKKSLNQSASTDTCSSLSSNSDQSFLASDDSADQFFHEYLDVPHDSEVFHENYRDFSPNLNMKTRKNVEFSGTKSNSQRDPRDNNSDVDSHLSHHNSSFSPKALRKDNRLEIHEIEIEKEREENENEKIEMKKAPKSMVPLPHDNLPPSPQPYPYRQLVSQSPASESSDLIDKNVVSEWGRQRAQERIKNYRTKHDNSAEIIDKQLKQVIRRNQLETVALEASLVRLGYSGKLSQEDLGFSKQSSSPSQLLLSSSSSSSSSSPKWSPSVSRDSPSGISRARNIARTNKKNSPGISADLTNIDSNSQYGKTDSRIPEMSIQYEEARRRAVLRVRANKSKIERMLTSEEEKKKATREKLLQQRDKKIEDFIRRQTNSSSNSSNSSSNNSSNNSSLGSGNSNVQGSQSVMLEIDEVDSMANFRHPSSSLSRLRSSSPCSTDTKYHPELKTKKMISRGFKDDDMTSLSDSESRIEEELPWKHRSSSFAGNSIGSSSTMPLTSIRKFTATELQAVGLSPDDLLLEYADVTSPTNKETNTLTSFSVSKNSRPSSFQDSSKSVYDCRDHNGNGNASRNDDQDDFDHENSGNGSSGIGNVMRSTKQSMTDPLLQSARSFQSLIDDSLAKTSNHTISTSSTSLSSPTSSSLLSKTTSTTNREIAIPHGLRNPLEIIVLQLPRAWGLQETLGGPNPYFILDWGPLGRAATQAVSNTTNPIFHAVLKFKSPLIVVSRNEKSDICLGGHSFVFQEIPLHIYAYSRNKTISDELLGEAILSRDSLLKYFQSFLASEGESWEPESIITIVVPLKALSNQQLAGNVELNFSFDVIDWP